MFKTLSVFLFFFTRAKGREGRKGREKGRGRERNREGKKRKGRKMDKRKTESSLEGAGALGEPETACLAHSEPWVHPQHHPAWVE